MATYALSREEADARARRTRCELFPELEKRWTCRARSLSGGEQQMLVLAQALVSQPRFILIDELSLGLAPVIVQRLIPTIRTVAESGVGVLLIEQFATVALGLAKRAYVIERGRIRFSGLAERAEGAPGPAAVRVPPRGQQREPRRGHHQLTSEWRSRRSSMCWS